MAMKDTHKIVVIVILATLILFAIIFLGKPNYYPIVKPSSSYYISGKIEFGCYNMVNGAHFYGNFSLNLFLTEDGALMEIINMTNGYGKTAMDYVLGEGFSSFSSPPGFSNTIVPNEFVLQYLNTIAKKSPYIKQLDDRYVGEIWLGV